MTEYNPPRHRDYEKWVLTEYQKLLDMDSPEEKLFQTFFEQNPCLVPGADSHFPYNYPYNNPTGHGPYKNALIAEPKISGIQNKIADFLWLSFDSSEFCPVFVEIENPAKKYFNRDETPTAKFTQALNQIKEWRSILNDPINRLKFYQEYAISKELSDSSFAPVFVLVYGSSKKEFNKNVRLSKKRKDWENNDEIIMSFDRIGLSNTHRNFVTCNIKNGEYHAKYVNPLFDFDSSERSDIKDIIHLKEAVKNSVFINQSQKNQLIQFIENEK